MDYGLEEAAVQAQGEAHERAVLGLCLHGGEGSLKAVEMIRRIIDPDGKAAGVFHDTRRAAIWRSIVRLTDQGVPPEPLAVFSDLQEHHEPGMRRIDALEVSELAASSPVVTAGTIRQHATKLVKANSLRDMTTVGIRLIQFGQDGDLDRAEDYRQRALEMLTAGGPVTTARQDTWSPVSLEDVLDGGDGVAPPTVMARSDGVMMLYPGRVHSIAGEPEAGKTWAALEAVVDAILSRGEHVFYIDYEDNARGIVSRLKARGVPDGLILALFHYIRPDRPIDTAARTGLRQLAEEFPPSVCVIDGVTEAMTMEGLELNDNTAAADWYARLPRFVTTLPGETGDGPAVLTIDHITKNRGEGSSRRFAIGAQHKLAGLDGCMYVLECVVPFMPGQAGWSRMYLTKDRHGSVKEHARNLGHGLLVIAEMHVSGDRDAVRVELRPPMAAAPVNESGQRRPTDLMGRIWRWIQANPGKTRNEIMTQVNGRTSSKNDAFKALVDDGWIVADRTRGGRYSTSRLWTGEDVEHDSDDEQPQEELSLDQPGEPEVRSIDPGRGSDVDPESTPDGHPERSGADG